MKARRSFLKRGISLAAILGLTGSVPTKAQKPGKSDFMHIVYIWLKNPEKDLQKVMSATEAFIKQVPTVNSYFIGTPAGTDRSVVDNSYSFNITVGFNDAESQDKYQIHPAHVKFVEENKDLWNKVVVYDSIR